MTVEKSWNLQGKNHISWSDLGDYFAKYCWSQKTQLNNIDREKCVWRRQYYIIDEMYTTKNSKDNELICQSEDTSVSEMEGCLEINTVLLWKNTTQNSWQSIYGGYFSSYEIV